MRRIDARPFQLRALVAAVLRLLPALVMFVIGILLGRALAIAELL
jgi:hypothetical protein